MAPLSADKPQIFIRVTDRGIGMDVAAQKNFFQLYSQADSSIQKRFGGTGLGLAISRSLEQLLHGELTCVSEVGVAAFRDSHFDVDLLDSHFDVDLLDSHMPKLNGFQAARQIRNIALLRHIHTPILGVSASCRTKDDPSYATAGMDDTTEKPFTQDVLHAKIVNWISLALESPPA